MLSWIQGHFKSLQLSRKYWDKKNQQVKRGYGANYAVINYELNKLKSKVIAKRDEYIRLGIEYTQ